MAKEQTAYRRPQNPVTYSENAEYSEKLATGRQYRELLCRMYGTLTIATAAATALKEDAPYALMKNVSVMVNGNVPIKTLTGKAILEKMCLNSRNIPDFTAPGLTVGNHAIEAFFRIGFWMPLAGLAADSTMLDASPAGGVKNATISCTWGQPSDLVTPDVTTVLSWATAPQIEIVSHDMVGLDTGNGRSYNINRERTIKQKVTSATDRFSIDIHGGPGRQVLSALVIARDSNVRTDAIINGLSVEDDVGVVYGKITGKMNQHVMNDLHEVEVPRTGVYFIDLAPRNLIGQGIQTTGRASLDIFLDVNAGVDPEIEVVLQELISATPDQTAG